MSPSLLPLRSLDYRIWHTCPSHLPAIHSSVFYFPQGHAELAASSPDFSSLLLPSPPFFPCNVSSISLLADQLTDEIYARISLDPLPPSPLPPIHSPSASSPFAKILTPSDANNGGGFSVPRFCAETIFPPLDHKMDPPPFQIIHAIDVQGRTWRFRHIYRGTPRRHLLTSGWSDFVSSKKLICGDTVVFIRGGGDLFVGIRRTGAAERRRGGVMRGDVMEAVRLAGMGRGFEVVFCPRVGSPEFVVGKEAVEAAVEVSWGPGMRVKMEVEGRVAWAHGTVARAAVPELGRWAGSPWRMLEIKWDEPEVQQRLRAVNPWQVKLISSVLPHQVIKKLKLPEGLKVSVEGNGSMTFPMTGFVSTGMESLTPSPFNISESPSGKQGARQIFSSLSSFFVPMSTNQVFSNNMHDFDMTRHPNMSRSDGITQVVKEVIHHNGVDIASACKTTKKSRKGSIQLFGQVIETEQLDDRNVSTEFSLSFAHNQLLDKKIRVSAVGACE